MRPYHMYLIPFNYKGTPSYEGYLMLSHINDAVIGCRRLGWNPVSMTVGPKEWEEMTHWTYSGQPESERLEVTGKLMHLTITQGKEDGITMLCEPWDGGKSHDKEFLAQLKKS